MKIPGPFTAEQATPADYEPILNMYRKANQSLLDKGIVQWNDEYPSPVVLKENLANLSTWVIRDEGRPIAVITLDEDQDPQYQGITWAYVSDRILVVHRLCVDPAYQKLGFARKLMQFAESFAFSNQCQAIRLDAYLGNPYSQKLYSSLGYQEAIGYCYYHPGPIMCNCFEKWVGG